MPSRHVVRTRGRRAIPRNPRARATPVEVPVLIKAKRCDAVKRCDFCPCLGSRATCLWLCAWTPRPDRGRPAGRCSPCALPGAIDGTPTDGRIGAQSPLADGCLNDVALSVLAAGLVGYTMRDIRYKWNSGSKSVGISKEVELPQFRVLGHRQRATVINLSTGNHRTAPHDPNI